MKREPDFDRVARVYRWAEYLSLGPLLQRTRTHFLPELAGCRRALVIGDGDGRFLARLLRQNPGMEAVAVDTSAAMLDLLRARCDSDRLLTVQGSALDVVPPQGIDLVVTHFFLDCLTRIEVDDLAAGISAAVVPGTLWILSDFQVPQRAVVGLAARIYIRGLYFAFGVLTGLRVRSLPDPQAALMRVGFVRVARHEKLLGLVYTEIWRCQ